MKCTKPFLSLLLFVACIPSGLHAQASPIALVQHASKDAGTASSATLAFNSNNSAGNWIGVCIRAGRSGEIFTVVDSLGNTYHKAIQFNVTVDTPNGHTLGIYYAENIADGPNTITVSDTTSASMRFAIVEYSGVAAANSLEMIAQEQGNGVSPNSGNAATTTNGDLLLGAISTANASSYTAGSGFTTVESVPAEPGTKLFAEQQVKVIAGSESAHATLAASDSWGSVLAGFKPGTGIVVIPNITSLSPSSGVVGTPVIITGTNFGTAVGTVLFNGTAGTPTSWSATRVVVPVPSGATTGNVVLTDPGVPSNGVAFTVTTPDITPPVVAITSPVNNATISGMTPITASASDNVAVASVQFKLDNANAGAAGVSAPYNLVLDTTTLSDGNHILTAVATDTSGNAATSTAVAVKVNNAPAGPSITSLNPTSGLVGAAVTISGTNFGTAQGTSAVTFNGITATPTSWSATSITAAVPAGATTGNVVVTVGGVASIGANFTVTVPAPNVMSLNPASGLIGTSVTIAGANFGATQGTSMVTFNGAAGISTAWSAVSITVSVPAGATTGNVVVAVGGVASNGITFAVTTPPPSITSLNPVSGVVGTSVTVAGTNFGATQGTSTITFNGTAGIPMAWSNTSITVLVPTGATTGSVLVTVGGQPSNGISFAVTIPSPTITSLTPVSGAVGTSVTVAGTNFGATQGTSTVTFNGTPGTSTAWSNTSITVSVPAGATTGNVIIAAGGGASNGSSFTVIVPPSIISLSPTSGAVGSSVTISGANFGAAQGTNTLTFNGTTATPTSWNATTITALVPAGATTGNVVVSVAGQASNGSNFAVTGTTTGAVALVQHASKDAGVTASSTLAFNSTNTAGNWVAVVIRAGKAGQVFTVSDTRGNTYRTAIQFNVTSDAPNGDTLGVFYAENIIGGANTVTVAESISNNTLRFVILEYSGIALANSLDAISMAQGVGANPNTGNALTTANSDLLLGALLTGNPQLFTAATGYTTRESAPASPNSKLAVEDQIQTSAGTVSASATIGSSDSWGAGLAAFKAASGGGSTGPSITSLNPATGLVGVSVTISGANFGATQGTSTVKFNGISAVPTSWSATSIVAAVPAGATTGNVVVTVGGTASNGVGFTVTVPAPSITSLNPATGLAGTSVTISGANFGASQGSSTVKFNGIGAVPTSWSATSIAVPVPAGATTGNVVVTVGGVASNGASFTVTSPGPSITNLNPSSGLVGAPVTVSGANFGATQGTSTVTFNGISGVPTSWSATSIVAAVPAGATTGNVVVTVGGVASNGVSFTVTVPAASITSLNPTSGLVGAPVTISGANFGATQGTSTVKFNGTTAVPTSWSATSIATTVPAGATTGNVVVTVGGTASNGVSFTVTVPPPSITSLNPTSGLVGAPITISGTNFGATQGSSTVKFNGITAVPTSWSATSIATPVPAGATTGNVVVTVGGVASNGVGFTVTADTTPPVVTITAPANNATVSGTITLTATATDPDSPVSFVQFQVDGANRGAQLTTAPYSLSLDTTTLSNANHTLTAVAQDPSGNVGTSATVTITVSNTSTGIPTLIYSTAIPLAVPSGSAWGGASPCGQNVDCYRIPLPEPTTAGATLIMAFSYDSTGGNQVFSVTDNGSDSWVLDATSAASNNKTMRMYRASNVSAGTTSINVQLSSGSQNGYWNALIGEFYNVGALDGSSCSAASSATISAGNLAPAHTGDLIFQAKYSAGLTKQTATFTSGLQPNITWSLASQLLGDGAADQYGVYNSTVPMSPTFTQAASDSYISCAVALQAASAGAAATAIPRVVHQEHDAMPKNAANPWHVGLVVDVPNAAVYLSYVGNDSISSVSSIPAPTVGWTASGADFQGLNGHNHVNYYCAQWSTPPGAVNLSINRSGSSNDSINMIYVVQNGTCNLDVDSGGQAGNQGSIGPLTTCANCLTPTKQNDFIMANGGQAWCTATGLTSPGGGIFDSAWFTGNTIDGPTQTDENNFWMHYSNGSSLNPFTITFAESCDFAQSDWAGRVAAYQTK